QDGDENKTKTRSLPNQCFETTTASRDGEEKEGQTTSVAVVYITSRIFSHFLRNAANVYIAGNSCFF
ncbi:hypothetical protein ABTN87_19330, partial [Acinetobacter baumannii]